MYQEIKAIIGLGNPGSKYQFNRHNIGFRIVDELAQKYMAPWHARPHMELTEIMVGGKKIILIKPQTYMNDSGKVIPYLVKQGIKPENILVVHDELELPFSVVKTKIGGSARGHNGLRSIISMCGPDFVRLRFGIARPENKDEVANYVLSNFSESPETINEKIEQAVEVIENLLTSSPS